MFDIISYSCLYCNVVYKMCIKNLLRDIVTKILQQLHLCKNFYTNAPSFTIFTLIFIARKDVEHRNFSPRSLIFYINSSSINCREYISHIKCIVLYTSTKYNCLLEAGLGNYLFSCSETIWFYKSLFNINSFYIIQ